MFTNVILIIFSVNNFFTIKLYYNTSYQTNLVEIRRELQDGLYNKLRVLFQTNNQEVIGLSTSYPTRSKTILEIITFVPNLIYSVQTV